MPAKHCQRQAAAWLLLLPLALSATGQAEADPFTGLGRVFMRFSLGSGSRRLELVGTDQLGQAPSEALTKPHASADQRAAGSNWGSQQHGSTSGWGLLTEVLHPTEVSQSRHSLRHSLAPRLLLAQDETSPPGSAPDAGESAPQKLIALRPFKSTRPCLPSHQAPQRAWYDMRGSALPCVA